jgi:hypothetical protein
MNAGNLIAVCFLSRDVAHREHLKTDSYPAHKALKKFYEKIVPLADSLAEACMGRHKTVIKDIPYLAPEGRPDVISQLEMHLAAIEAQRYRDLDKADTPLQNIVDEIVKLYLDTLYMLRRFK